MNDHDLLFKAAETLRSQIQSRDEERMSTNRVYTQEQIEQELGFARARLRSFPDDNREILCAIIEQLRSELQAHYVADQAQTQYVRSFFGKDAELGMAAAYTESLALHKRKR